MKTKTSVISGIIFLFIVAVMVYIIPTQMANSADSSSETDLIENINLAGNKVIDLSSYNKAAEHTKLITAAELPSYSSSKKEQTEQANVSSLKVKNVKEEQVKETPMTSDSSTIVSNQASKSSSNKTVYLTFDDGPGKHTAEVLDILEDYEIPATFFVLGKYVETYPELIYRMHEQGHAIGNHTYNHDYAELYDNFPGFWSQIKSTEDAIRLITGSRPQLVRAPGGTFGHFDQAYFDLLDQAGYTVVDWNVDSGDSKRAGVPAKEIVQNATNVKLDKDLVILLHDGGNHEETVKALPEIIEYYKEMGYAFAVLDPSEKPVQFRVKNDESTKKRFQPSKEWIINVIAGNADLFEKGPALIIEAGKQVTELKYGEYRLEKGQYLVPLRDVIEKFGGSALWKAKEREAVVVLGGSHITVKPEDQMITAVKGEASYSAKTDIYMRDGAIWVPLRTLLEAADHRVVSLARGTEEVVVRAS
ncbi:polysaccharide deacetylase [Neobacillus mesonae]|nr:polysaccharide deacetylase [Neobacillus mesonae]